MSADQLFVGGRVPGPAIPPPPPKRRFVPLPAQVPKNTTSPSMADYEGPGTRAWANSHSGGQSLGSTSSGRQSVGQSVSSARPQPQPQSRPRLRTRTRQQQPLSQADRGRYAAFMASLQLRPSPLIPAIPLHPPMSELYDRRKYPTAWTYLVLGESIMPLPPELMPKPPADVPRLVPGRPTPNRAKITDIATAPIVVKAATAYKQGKMAVDMGWAMSAVPMPSMLLADRLQRHLPAPVRRYTDAVRGVGGKVVKALDPIDKAASAVLWLDAEERYADGEITQSEVNLARLGMLLTAASMVPNPAVAGTAMAAGTALDWYQLGQKVTRDDDRAVRARGGIVRHGETTLVGERGPEIVRLPAGSNVIPAHRSRELLERPPVAASASRRRRELHIHQQLDGLEVARSTVRHLDDDEQWGRR